MSDKEMICPKGKDLCAKEVSQCPHRMKHNHIKRTHENIYECGCDIKFADTCPPCIPYKPQVECELLIPCEICDHYSGIKCDLNLSKSVKQKKSTSGECPKCNGYGQVSNGQPVEYWPYCPDCKGTGKTPQTGKQEQGGDRIISVKVPRVYCGTGETKHIDECQGLERFRGQAICRTFATELKRLPNGRIYPCKECIDSLSKLRKLWAEEMVGKIEKLKMTTEKGYFGGVCVECTNNILQKAIDIIYK